MPVKIRIKTVECHSISIKNQKPCEVKIRSAPIQNVSGEAGGGVYKGPYTITPSDEQVILETKSKTMTEDVTVKKIPLWETSNVQGGTTLLIGGERYYGL